MKKRLLTIALMLALLVTAMAILPAVSANEAAQPQAESTLVLPTVDEWIEIGTKEQFMTAFGGNGSTSTNLQNLPETRITKYYRLTDNITIDEECASTGFFMNTDSHFLDVYMDLNGKTLTLAESSGAKKQGFLAYDPNGKLTVVNGTLINKKQATIPGGLFRVQGGCDLELQDVTINDTKTSAFTSKGGIISIEGDGNATMTNVKISTSNTTGHIGANTVLGGAIYCLGNLTMTDCEITGTINYNLAWSGGLIYHEGTGELNLTRCAFTGGNAVFGGAIYATGSATNLTDCSFTGGKAQRSNAKGGNLWQTGGSLTMDGCSFTNGIAVHSGSNSTYGGNVYVDGATVDLTDCTFEGGSVSGASSRGANLNVEAGTLKMKDCNFTGGNAAYGANVMIYNTTSVDMTNCDFMNGVGAQQGGNLRINAASGVSYTLTMDGCSFSGGQSALAGNVYVDTATTTLTNCTFTGGKSTGGVGGSFRQLGGTVTITGGSFTGGQASTNGGNLYFQNCTATITNANISGGKATADGGNICLTNSAKLYFKSGTISGGSAKNGGNIATSAGGGSGLAINIQGGTISGGTASANGGNIYSVTVAGAANAPALNVSAGTISGGKATGDGGNIYVAGNAAKAASGTTAAIAKQTATFTMTGGTVGGTIPQGKKYAGEATNGGNLFATYATVNVSGGQLSNSYSSTHGGNMYASTACTMNISGTAVISNGFANSFGGNLYMSSTNSRLNILGGTVSGGTAYYSGGNIYQNNGLLTITGGTITDGFADWCGGNIYSSMGYAGAGNITIKAGTNGSVPQILNGTANSYSGGNIHVEAAGNKDSDTATNSFVFGNFVCSGGYAKTLGQDVYIAAVTDLQVLAECAQTVRVYIEDAMLPAAGEAVLDTNRATCTGVFTGKLVLENRGNPYILGKADSTNLYLTTAALVQNDGTRTWYADNAAAVAAYASNTAYLQAAPGELALNGGTYTVDIGGYTLNFTGTGEVTCFDSSNDTFKTFGKVTVAGPTVNTGLVRVGDKTYYTINENDTYTSHCVEIKIVTTSLRPSIGGIYFTGRWSCDDTLKPYVDGFGVVVSLYGMPGDDFETDNLNSRWTVFDKSDFASGVTKTGVMISGIVKSDRDDLSENASYGKMPVNAKAYITIDGKNYTGLGKSYSLYDILKILSDNIIDYRDHETSLVNFMNRWSAKGLTGEGWDDLSFTVSEEIKNLNTLYAGTTAYHGELHDHANTGGTSDGGQTLSLWKEEMGRLNMDFATIVDHKQTLHMYLEDWDNTMFIGGSEAACSLTDRTGVKMHYNMVFASPEGLENVLSSFPEFNWQYYPEDYTGTNAEQLAGGWHFDYPNFTHARFTELCEAIYANGGFLSIVHPKYKGYVTSDDPADVYFMDGQGVEVFYTFRSSTASLATKDNHKLWTDMLKEGYKVYATAGNDEHDMPSDKAVSAIYASEKTADAWVKQLRNGNFTAGGVGIRSAIGDTVMGGTTSFAGQKLAFSVGDFHESQYNPDHTYRVDVVTDSGVVYSQEISCTDTFYHVLDVDADAAYYYFEVYDVTKNNTMIAIGNPIWNADK